MSKELTVPIPARLKNVAKNGHVAGVEDIYDDELQKTQKEINAEQEGSIAAEVERATRTEELLQNEVNALSRQNYVSVDSYSELPELGSVDTIYRVGSWDGTQVDPTKYAEYAWNNTGIDQGEYKLLSVKTQVGEVFDISDYRSGATYADLAAALDGGNNVPVGIRKGGMEIKFVQSSDNKYVQYRLMADEWSTDTKDWAMSSNTIKIQNPEYGIVLVDKMNRILVGIKKDGDVFYGAGVPSQIVDFVNSNKAELLALINNKQNKETGKGLIQNEVSESLSLEVSPEYAVVETDKEQKILGGREKDGTKFENMPMKMPSAIFESKRDYDKRGDVEIDAENKLLSYRKKNGTKVENAGIETTTLELSDEGKEKLKEDLNVNVNDGDILSLHPKETILPILKTFKERPSWFLPYTDNYKYINFNLLWFSDLHHVGRRLARISKFYNEYKDYIDDVISSGDIQNQYWEDVTFWHNNGADSFLNVIGNHECLGGERVVDDKILPGWVAPGFSQKECYDRFFKDYISDTGIIIQENKSYWYKDYVLPARDAQGDIVENAFAYKIRLIGIDLYHWKESRTYSDGTPMEQWPDGQPLDTGQQQLWLRETLEDARNNGISVICVEHNPVSSSNLDEENTPFQCLPPYIFDTTFIKDEILDEVQTFIDNGGTFITWLTGHTHDDRFGVINSHPEQLMITIGTAGNYIQNPGDMWEFPSFMDRTEKTMNDDLFDVVSVNTFAHTITLFRIGCPYDKHGRHLDSISYDYINKQIL